MLKEISLVNYEKTSIDDTLFVSIQRDTDMYKKLSSPKGNMLDNVYACVRLITPGSIILAPADQFRYTYGEMVHIANRLVTNLLPSYVTKR